jgi:Spy/CpxP family protein refolding chaperone
LNRWKSIIGVLLILGVGFLSGFTVSSYLGKRASRPPRPDEFLSIVQENTIRDLSLTPEQQAVLAQAVVQARKQLEELNREVHPRVRAIIRGAQDKLIPVLTPEQKAKLEEIRMRHQRRHREEPAKGAGEKEG